MSNVLGVLILSLVAAAGPSVTPTELRFTAVAAGQGASAITPAQAVFLERTGDEASSWSAAAGRPWLEVRPSGGTLPARVWIAVRPGELPRTPGRADGAVVFTIGGTSLTLPVSLDVRRDGQPPIGAIDAPADRAVLPPGLVRLSGWALDDVGVSQIEICRDPVSRSSSRASCSAVVGTQLGTAAPYGGARPDVAAIFPAFPRSDRGAWTYVLDTSAWPRRELGTFRLHVIARDVDGHAATIGTRTMTIEPAEAPAPPRPIGRLAAIAGAALAGLGVHWLLRRRSPVPGAADPSPDPGGPPPVSLGEGIAIGAIVVIAAAAAARPAGGLSYDELYTYTHFVGVPPWHGPSSVGVFNNHFAYSLLAGIPVRLFGASDWAVRLPAALLGTATVLFVWRFARAFAGRPAALLSALLLAASPMHLAWSHAARGYTGLALMTVISSRAFFLLLRRPSRGAAATYVAATVAGIYFHLYGVWIAAIQYAVIVALTLRSRITAESFTRLWRSFLAIGVLATLLYSPVLLLLLEMMGAGTSRARTAVQPHFPLVLYDALTGSTSVALRAIAGALLALGLLRLRSRPLHLTYIVLLLAVPVAVAWLLLRPANLYPRFFHYWTPMACVLIAVAVTGIGTAERRSRRLLMSVVAGVLTIPLLTAWIRQDAAPASDGGYRQALLGVTKEANDESRQARTLLAGPDAVLLRYYLGQPFEVVESADDIDQTMREDPARLLVISHTPGWQGAEHARIGDLLGRRCTVTPAGLVTIYRCR